MYFYAPYDSGNLSRYYTRVYEQKRYFFLYDAQGDLEYII